MKWRRLCWRSALWWTNVGAWTQERAWPYYERRGARFWVMGLCVRACIRLALAFTFARRVAAPT